MIGINNDNLENYLHATNNTKNGKCSNCGECCTNFLPISTKEAKLIFNYIKKHNIKEQIRTFPINGIVMDGVCPFRDNINKICLCYAVRPAICREYICSENKEKSELRKKLYYKKYNIVDMRATFFKENFKD